MILPKLFKKEILIRLQCDGTWVSTVNYGCLGSKREVIDLARRAWAGKLPDVGSREATRAPLSATVRLNRPASGD